MRSAATSAGRRTRGIARVLLSAALACQPRSSEPPYAAPRSAPELTPERATQASTASVAAAGVPSAWQWSLDVAPVQARRFIVVSDAPIATRAGADRLARGGNAIDAAITVAFVLAVVYPEAGNLGGGGFAVVRDAHGGRAALDFRETAPARAHRSMYVREQPGGSTPAPGSSPSPSREGHLAAGVPGSVAGLWALHQRYGTAPWAALVGPAIELAEDGFEVDERLARAIADAEPKLGRFATSRALLLPAGHPPRAGDVLRNPELGATLRRIAEQGPAGFYGGATAELVTREMERGGGLLTLADLARYEPRWRAPIELEYHGHTIVSMPPPSSGGVALALIANMLEKDALGPYHGPTHVHLLAEAMRRAFADRNSLLGDPDFVSMPLGSLLSEAYAAERRGSFTSRATPSSQVAQGLPRPEGEHTTHFAVVDGDGSAVSLTTTLNDFFGSGVSVEGAGFLLNDEMDDFTTEPGKPNLYGLVQGEANAIAPEKRMLSSMAPTLVLDPSGAVRVVAGARGGPRIITATWQVISNILDFGMDASAAVRAPRVHQQWYPDELLLESGGFSPEQSASLEALGYALRTVADLASAPVIARDALTSRWTAAPDPRRGGAAAGE
jgi:gamma-glutamyltranspeptidase / glutathione hydrolase